MVGAECKLVLARFCESVAGMMMMMMTTTMKMSKAHRETSPEAVRRHA